MRDRAALVEGGPLDGWTECPRDDCPDAYEDDAEEHADGAVVLHGVEHHLVVDHYLIRDAAPDQPNPGRTAP